MMVAMALWMLTTMALGWDFGLPMRGMHMG